MSRPTTFTQELADQICERLADGSSLRSICRDESMPSKAMVFQWLSGSEVFADQYARAREAQADALADEILDIANTPQLGIKKKTTDKGTEIVEGDMIEHRRLQVDARKWIASKLKPKKYGDRLMANVAGPNDGPIPLDVTSHVVAAIAVTNEVDEAARLYAELLTAKPSS